MRSPSRDAVIEGRNALREEAKYVREHVAAVANGEIPVSHGRGGAGNISGSRSRSRSRDPVANPTGKLVDHRHSFSLLTPLALGCRHPPLVGPWRLW